MFIFEIKKLQDILNATKSRQEGQSCEASLGELLYCLFRGKPCKDFLSMSDEEVIHHIRKVQVIEKE